MCGYSESAENVKNHAINALFPRVIIATLAHFLLTDATILSGATHGDGRSIGLIRQIGATHLCGILRKPTIIHCAIPKLPFDPPERMRSECPCPGNAFLQPLCLATFAPMRDRAVLQRVWLQSHTMPIQRAIPSVFPSRYLHRLSHLGHAGAVCLGHLGDIGCCASGPGALHRCMHQLQYTLTSRNTIACLSWCDTCVDHVALYDSSSNAVQRSGAHRPSPSRRPSPLAAR